MKRTVFLIGGYGIPLDIEADPNYLRYLYAALNSVFGRVTSRGLEQSVLVLSGGQTGRYKPFTTSEATEMARIVRPWLTKPLVKKQLRGLKLVLETKALSTLDNSLLTTEKLSRMRVVPERVVIFCEWTRVAKTRAVARLVWGSGVRVEVIGVDFDTSDLRYLDPAYLRKKEAKELRIYRKALGSPATLRRFRALCKERIHKIRAAGTNFAAHQQAIRDWWDTELDKYLAS